MTSKEKKIYTISWFCEVLNVINNSVLEEFSVSVKEDKRNFVEIDIDNEKVVIHWENNNE